MNRTIVARWAVALGCVAGTAVFSTDARAQGYGSIEGQVIVDGAPPAPKMIAATKDQQVCGANVPSDEVLVDSATGGLANVFIYKKDADKVHPDLQKSKEAEVVFDQKGCRFIPHSLLVRTDQVVRVISSDAVAHNTHTFPLRNQGINVILKPNDQMGVKVPMPQAELLPTNVKCDIHPWMSAYWLVLDHPYAAVSSENGTFKIENLPAGEHEFRVWHEKKGFIERKLVVKVEAGKTTKVPPIKVKAADLK